MPASIPDSTPTGVVDRWADAQDRRDWAQQRRTDPDRTKPVTSPEAWAIYQRRVTGATEVQLGEGDNEIWADGLQVDPDTVVVAEAKYVIKPERSMYEGRVSPRLIERLFRDFDDEMRRYGQLIKDPGNPVRRLRIIASTQAAADYLGARARRILGPDIDIDVRYTP